MAALTREPWAVGAAATAFLLPVAYSPSVHAPFWSPKLAVLLVAGFVGLTLLPTVLRRCRGAAIAGMAFVAVAALSTLVAPRPIEALTGIYGWGTGLVFIACLLGLWALGASVERADAQRLVVPALLVGAAASGAVGLVQAVTTIPLDVLDTPGRSTGLAGNAVHLGTISAVGAVLSAWCARRDASIRSVAAGLAGIAGFVAAAQVSGTRTALVVLVVGLAIAGAVWSRRRLALIGAAAVVGFVLGNVLASVGGGVTATARVDDRVLAAAPGTGISVRLDVWTYARHAVADRPLLGHGPGRFQAATSADRTASIARAEGPAVTYSDAHNLLVEHTVTTGVLGVAALVWWLVAAARRARGPFLAAAAVVLVASLLQPQTAGTTPLLFLSLGLAAASSAPAPSRHRSALAGVAVGAVLAGTIVVGDVSLLRARDTFQLADARRADVLLRPWPQPASILARIHTFRAIDAPPGDERDRERDEARRWRNVAVRRTPAFASLWVDLAEDEYVDGLVDDASRHYHAALDRDPYAIGAMVGLARIALDADDVEEATHWLEQVRAVAPSERLDDLLEELDGES